MKRKGFFALSIFMAASCGLSVSAQDAPANVSEKLDVSNFTIVNESISHIPATKRGAEILFDSQDQIPATPAASKIDISGQTWQPNYRIEWGEPSFYIDLGAYYVISDIGYMDMNGSPAITVFQGEPFGWTELGTLPTNYYKTYRVAHFDSATATRFIRVTSNGSDTGINEIGLYGYKISDLTEEDTQKTQAKPAELPKDNLTSGVKIGANAFCDDPYTALSALGNVREYYNWSWLTDKEGNHYFNRIVNKDNFYRTMQSMGISMVPCLQGINDHFVGNGENIKDIFNTIPVEDGADTLDPASYALHGNAMYNLAARYGSNTDIDPATLNVGDGDIQVGLNYLEGIETWNEQDKTWETKQSYFHPYEYAAMVSTDYDGHEGTVPNAGVKTADPNFKLVMGGVAGGDRAVEYLSLMKSWFDYNRTDGKFALDTINYHDYITDTEAPENSDFRQNARNIIEWTNENAPGRDVWLSEFDIVADDKKIEGVDSHQNQEYAKARAERLLRAFLVGEREGLDRMSMFMLRDEWSGVYANSGLTTGKGDWDKKTSWYYLACATDTLKNADLIDFSEQDNVYLYTYQDRDTSEVIYAVWSPTADGSEISDYQLTVGSPDKAIQVTPSDRFKEGSKEILPVSSEGTVTIQVSETPVFVKTSGQDVENDPFPQQRIQVQQMRLGDQRGSIDTITFDNKEVVNVSEGGQPSSDNFMLTQFWHLFDEQIADKTAETPWIKTRVNPTTEMSAIAVHKDRAYPYDCILTFDDIYTITYIGIYDTYGTGQMDIIDDMTGELIYSSKLNTYNTWDLVPMTSEPVHTNRIRIVKYDDAKLNELAFYGYPEQRRVGIDAEPVPGEIGAAVTSELTLKEIASVDVDNLSRSSKNPQTVDQAFQKLFDEQNLLPANDGEAVSKDAKFATNFSNIWGSGMSFPYDAVVTFPEPTTITKAGIFVGWGLNNGNFEIYNNETGELLASDTLTGNWKMMYLTFPEPVETSSLRIVKYNERTICEIGFY